ncbi:PepSY domain-containing protein [Methylomonas rivi]|uniref:PepSY domain-containing protein n=1 Tax=Methylomonas rivi TaxID=2952226 RepID=UPI0035318EEA
MAVSTGLQGWTSRRATGAPNGEIHAETVMRLAARSLNTDNGVPTYEFDIKGKEMKVEVDAASGKIVEANSEVYQIDQELGLPANGKAFESGWVCIDLAAVLRLECPVFLRSEPAADLIGIRIRTLARFPCRRPPTYRRSLSNAPRL